MENIRPHIYVVGCWAVRAEIQCSETWKCHALKAVLEAVSHASDILD